MEQRMNMLDLLIIKNKLSELEKDTLLSELICTYVSDQKSELLDLLISADLSSFQDRVKFMNTQGEKIRKSLKEIKNGK